MNLSILQNETSKNLSMEKNMTFEEGDDSNPVVTANDKQSMIVRPIVNAGLVIMQAYMGPLFNRLGLTSDDDFSSEVARQKAIRCLQYMVTGQENSDEKDWTLTKLLCGLPVNDPIESTVEFKALDTETMDRLIKSMIAYWPENGSTTVEGFRGNWLLRNGTLSENTDRWELVIEKRDYDVLMEHAPFFFSIIKFRWMKKPLYVTWDY